MPLKTVLSPHVTIYRFPLAALSSITHRITGIMMAGASLGLAVAALGYSNEGLKSQIQEFNANHGVLSYLARLSILTPLTFHYLSGCRHLYWDKTLKGITLQAASQSSKAIIGGTAAISLIFSAIRFD